MSTPADGTTNPPPATQPPPAPPANQPASTPPAPEPPRQPIVVNPPAPQQNANWAQSIQDAVNGLPEKIISAAREAGLVQPPQPQQPPADTQQPAQPPAGQQPAQPPAGQQQNSPRRRTFAELWYGKPKS